MGYTTDFTGSVTVDPPLNAAEVDYLARFADSRRFNRPDGPYALHENDGYGRANDGYNQTPQGQPSLWCNWTPTADGTSICWNGAEKFYDSPEWMQYLIDTFLKPGATLQLELAEKIEGRYYDPMFGAFTFDHTVNGSIDAQGEDEDDTWRLVVTGNQAERVETDGGPTDAIDDTPANILRCAAAELRSEPEYKHPYEFAIADLFDEVADSWNSRSAEDMRTRAVTAARAYLED